MYTDIWQAGTMINDTQGVVGNSKTLVYVNICNNRVNPSKGTRKNGNKELKLFATFAIPLILNTACGVIHEVFNKNV